MAGLGWAGMVRRILCCAVLFWQGFCVCQAALQLYSFTVPVPSARLGDALCIYETKSKKRYEQKQTNA